MIDLREIRDEDSDRLFHWRREPEVDRWMYGLPPGDMDEHLAWWSAFRRDPDRTGWVILRDGRPVGLITLQGLASPHRRAQLGWFIGEPEARGRGLGRAAQALGLDRAFGEHDLVKVWSQVLADNDTALKAQAAAGFKREGYMRRHCWKVGRFHDVVLLGILQEEWARVRSSVLRDLAGTRLIAA